MIIYKATNKVNGKVYIGQTVNSLEVRKRQHLNSHKYNSFKCTHFSNAIKKYGPDSFCWDVLAEVDDREELDRLEVYFISLYNSTDHSKGYNLLSGGSNGYYHSSVTKKRIGDAQKGAKNHMFGLTGSSNPTSKEVVCLDTLEVYSSATECATTLGLSLSKVCAVCRGDRATTGGMRFRYVGSENIEVKSPKKTRRIYDETTQTLHFTLVNACVDITGDKSSYSAMLNTIKYNIKKGRDYVTWRGHKLWFVD